MGKGEAKKNWRNYTALALRARGSEGRSCPAESIAHLFEQTRLRPAGCFTATVMLDLLLVCGTIILASIGLLIGRNGFRTDTTARYEKRHEQEWAHRIVFTLSPIFLSRSISLKL